MMEKKVKAKLAIVLSVFGCMAAHAEWNIGVLAGINGYTTKLRGDALYAYGTQYLQHPADITEDNFAVGLTVSFLYHLYPCISFGSEAVYLFLNENETRLRADNLENFPVEYFTTRSDGIGIADFVLRFNVTPTLDLNIFGGPAWLSTYYKDNDFANGFSRETTHGYQFTADIGVSSEWNFCQNWLVGMRFDYIFDTRNQNIATIGSRLSALNVNTYASSRVMIATGIVKYRFYD